MSSLKQHPQAAAEAAPSRDTNPNPPSHSLEYEYRDLPGREHHTYEITKCPFRRYSDQDLIASEAINAKIRNRYPTNYAPNPPVAPPNRHDATEACQRVLKHLKPYKHNPKPLKYHPNPVNPNDPDPIRFAGESPTPSPPTPPRLKQHHIEEPPTPNPEPSPEPPKTSAEMWSSFLHNYHNKTPSSSAPPPSNKKYLKQQPLKPPRDRPNCTIGDPYDPTSPDLNMINIFTKNPNGIVKERDRKNYDEWNETSTVCNHQQIHAIGFPETNFTFNKDRKFRLQKIYRKFCPNGELATATSTEPSSSEYKPGGTLTAIDGLLASRRNYSFEDPSGLGRWSGFALRRKSLPDIVIMTVYRVCKKSYKPAKFSAYNQQWRLLKKAGVVNPEPRKQVLLDLTQFVNSLHAEKTPFIILMDANEPIDGNEGMKQFMEDTGLVDTFSLRHPASRETHICGSQQIDFILISPDLVPALRFATVHKFYDPPYCASDHCAVSAHFDRHQLLGMPSSTLSMNQPRYLFSENPYIVSKYVNKLQKSFKELNLLKRRDLLDTIEPEDWNNEHQQALEALDQDFTRACIRAERACAFPTDSPWSPKLHLAYLLRQYWELKLSSQRTGRDASSRLNSKQRAISETYEKIRPEDSDDIPKILTNWDEAIPKSTFRLAKKFIKQCRQQAWDLRLEYLATCAELAALGGDTRRESTLRKIRAKEERA